MLLDLIVTAEMLSEGMNKLSDELLAALESSGKKEYFEQEVQVLIAQSQEIQTPADVQTFAENIHRLVYEMPELKAKLIADVSDRDGPPMGYDEETEIKGEQLDELNEQIMEAAAGARQHLIELVPDVKPPQTDNSPSLFNRLLAQLRGRKNNE